VGGNRCQAFQIAFLFAAMGRSTMAPTNDTAIPISVVVMRPETLEERFSPTRTMAHPRNAATTPASLIAAGCPLSAISPSSGLMLKN
jgi:hypothetical protein